MLLSILRGLVTIALGSVMFASAKAETLPKITPKFLIEIQRVAATITLAEFPIKTSEVSKILDLPYYESSGGMGGKNIRSREWWLLSDPADPIGHYRLNVFSVRGEVTGIQLVYQPKNQGVYSPAGDFIQEPRIDPEVRQRLRLQMH